MTRLPTIPGLQPVQLDSPGMRVGAAAAPAAALGGLAESIAGVSAHFYDTALHVQKLENARVASEKRNQLSSDYAQHQLDLESDPDPQSRMQKTAAFLSSYKGQMSDASLPPAVQDDLQQHFDQFATQATIHQAADSAKLAQRRATLAMDNELQGAMDSGDGAGAHAVVKRFVASGAMLPEQGEALARKIDFQGDVNGMRRQIAADPIAMEQQLDSADWVAKNPRLAGAREHLLSEASRGANRERSDFANNLIISGEDPSLDDLANMEDYGYISKATHAQWAQKVRAGDLTVGTDRTDGTGTTVAGSPRRSVALPVDPAIHNEALSAVYQYDPANDPGGLGEASLRSHIASLPVAAEQRKVLNEKLDLQINPVTRAQPKNFHDAAFHGRIDTEFTRGDFGKYEFMVDEDNNPKTAPTKAIDAKEYDKAWETRQLFTDEWKGILSTLPLDAPFPVVNAAYTGLKTKYKDAKAPPEVSFTPIPAPAFDPARVYRGAGGSATAPQASAEQSHTVVPQIDADTSEGVAVPLLTLQAQFPGRDTEWLAANARVVTRGPGGLSVALPVGSMPESGDAGGIRLSPQTVRQIGGRIGYDAAGKPVSAKGLAGTMALSVVSIDTGGVALAGAQWPEVKAAWFQTNQPKTYSQIDAGLVALRQAWQEANAGDTATDRNKPLERSGIAPLKPTNPLHLTAPRR